MFKRFSMKKEPDPKKEGEELLKQINKWFVKPDPHNMDSREMKRCTDKQDFLKALPGSEEFLKELQEKLSNALEAKPIDQKAIADTTADFKILMGLADHYRENKDDMDRLSTHQAVSDARAQQDSVMKAYYKRFEEIFGQEPVASITTKHFKAPH